MLAIRNASRYSGHVGEAETGNGGDQPDKRIAGPELIRMQFEIPSNAAVREREPPSMGSACSSRRVLYLARGPDQRKAAPRLRGLECNSHVGIMIPLP
jgi:hypothetical protein